MLRGPSIRRRLLWLLLAALALGWGAAAAVTYVDAHHEVDALLDAHLRQSARLLVAQAGHDLEELDLDDDEIDAYGTDVAFQVRTASGRVLLRSANAPREALSRKSHGFGVTRAGGRHWRVYSASDDHGETVVHVAEDDAARERIARRIALGALAPILVALPLLGLLVWWIVGRSLRPLARLGDEIARRGADDLAPVAVGPVPSELAPLVQRLDGLLLRIRDSLDAERRFTSHAAHELRTPVAALRAQAEVASTTQDPGVRARALAHCIEGCDRTARLVSQLLLLTRADELAALPDARRCDLADVAQTVLAQAAPEAVEAGTSVSLDAPAACPVQGDPALLEILVRNLVDNAVRHGGGEVRVSLRAEPEASVLVVEDDGPGVPAEALAQLGRRFYRAPEARGAGSGLGLSIVARIAELHHAAVRFENRPHGRGFRVSVRLPR